MEQAIRELHDCGFVSRDVKPGNFAPGIRANHQSRTILIFDFGLARLFRDKDNNVLPSRGVVGWRGTTRYASLMVRAEEKDQAGAQPLGPRPTGRHRVVVLHARRSDQGQSALASHRWFPSAALRDSDRAAVEKAKRMVRGSMQTQFFYETPDDFKELLDQVDALSFADDPPYARFSALLVQALKKVEGGDKDPTLVCVGGREGARRSWTRTPSGTGTTTRARTRRRAPSVRPAPTSRAISSPPRIPQSRRTRRSHPRPPRSPESVPLPLSDNSTHNRYKLAPKYT